jgi:hypothetical protein
VARPRSAAVFRARSSNSVIKTAASDSLSRLRFMNDGIATANMTPSMAITTTSSSRVKPTRRERGVTRNKLTLGWVCRCVMEVTVSTRDMGARSQFFPPRTRFGMRSPLKYRRAPVIASDYVSRCLTNLGVL